MEILGPVRRTHGTSNEVVGRPPKLRCPGRTRKPNREPTLLGGPGLVISRLAGAPSDLLAAPSMTAPGPPSTELGVSGRYACDSLGLLENSPVADFSL